MRRKSYADMVCSIAQTLEVVGDPWTLLIVRDVFFGYTRFDDLQARLGVPRTTLADRLAALCDHGVLDRRLYQERPERFEYVLTAKGRGLRDVLIALLRWGDEWSSLGEAPVVLVESDTGRQLDPVLVDRTTGKPLDEIRFKAMPGPGAHASTAPPER